MAHEKATPRPWAWEWDPGSGNITIFQPSMGLNSVEIAEVYCENTKSDKAKKQAEDEADLIVSLVNRHHEEQQKLLGKKIREEQQDG